LTVAGLAGGLLTALLTGTAALHAWWGLGGSFPAADRDSLALLAIGQRQVPPPLACFAVALAVAGMAMLPAINLGWIGPPPLLRRLAAFGCWAAAAIFAVRGIAGYTVTFDRIFPLEPFHTMNRLAYSPLCLLLALLFVVVARSR
jgi:hypothetical protein